MWDKFVIIFFFKISDAKDTSVEHCGCKSPGAPTVIYRQTLTCLSLTTSDCSVVVNSWRAWGKIATQSNESSSECCSMPGVKCAADGKTVLELDWNSQELKGAIPQEIGKLKNLTVL